MLEREEIIIPESVVFNKSVYEQFKYFTRLHGTTEWGGLGIGIQNGTAFYVRAIVLPPQKTHNLSYCEFRKELFPVITKRLMKLQEKMDKYRDYRIGLWIHTHPGFGAFFSGTDISTFNYLTKLSPDYLGIVVDPIQNQVIGFNSRMVIDHNTGTLKSFETIPIDFDENEQNERDDAFLSELMNALSSPQAAREIGSSSPIEVFIPLSKIEHQLKTMDIRLQYLERKIIEYKQLSEFYVNQSQYVFQLREWMMRTNLLYMDTLIPSIILMRPQGLYYSIRLPEILTSSFIKWNTISEIEIIILTEELIAHLNHVSSIILINIIKRVGFLRTKTIRLLVHTTNLERLMRYILEFYPGVVIRRLQEEDLIETTAISNQDGWEMDEDEDQPNTEES